MSVAVLLVTHNDIGAQLKQAAGAIFKQDMPALETVSIPADLAVEDLGKYADLVRESIQQQNRGDGVLVLTDLHGATPSNLARHFCNGSDACVVSGVNLPMLLRVLNYTAQPLQELAETAVCGGKSGVKRQS